LKDEDYTQIQQTVNDDWGLLLRKAGLWGFFTGICTESRFRSLLLIWRMNIDLMLLFFQSASFILPNFCLNSIRLWNKNTACLSVRYLILFSLW